jgi:hypothetical protein
MEDDADTTVPQPRKHLDVDEERARLADLKARDEALAHKAHEDLDVGGSGRIYADPGVHAQVEGSRDTRHPLADRP